MAEIMNANLVRNASLMIEAMQAQLEVLKGLIAPLAAGVQEEEDNTFVCKHCGAPLDEANEATCMGGPPTYGCACGKLTSFQTIELGHA